MDTTPDVISFDSVECYATEPLAYIVAKYMTLGACSTHCRTSGHPVFAAQDETCTCFDILPSYDEKVDASLCNQPCPGYAGETCGGQSGYFTVGTVPGVLVAPSREPSLSASTTGTITTTIVSNATGSDSSSQTSPATTVVSPSNTSSTVTSGSPPGSSGSASPTAESSAAGRPIFSKGATLVASILSAVVVLGALI